MTKNQGDHGAAQSQATGEEMIPAQGNVTVPSSPDQVTPPELAGVSDLRAVIDPAVGAARNGLAETLAALETLAQEYGDAHSARLAGESLAALHGPFRFVVLGEVKSGKSSFVNALLCADICKVAPEPCTDAIQEIVYGPEEGIEVIGTNRKRIQRNIPLLKAIAIVDTPGANSVVRDHEAITREFIPHSDLVIFVLPARNPHTQSAWELLKFAHEEWDRKVIFVLQQMDLELDHLPTQLRSVHDYAVKNGIRNPAIFATSAKWENQGLVDQSGMSEVRRFIRQRITGGAHVLRKMQGHAAVARKVLSDIRGKLDVAQRKLDEDRALREKVEARLGVGRERSMKEVDDLLERLSDAYDAITADIKDEFRKGMEVWPVLRRSLPGGTSNREWLAQISTGFEKALDQKVNRISQEEAGRFLESLKRLILDLLEETKRDVSPLQTAGTLGSIDAQRRQLLDGIQKQLEDLARDQEPLRHGLSESSRHVGQAIVGGGLLTGLGAIIATATKLAIFDVTGGVLAAAGLLVAGFALIWRRGHIINEFSDALAKGKTQFQREVRDRITADLRGIYSVIADKFGALNVLVQSQEKDLARRLGQAGQIQERLDRMDNHLATLLENR